MSFLQQQGEVDFETVFEISVFEISDGMDSYKVMYGPAYTIVFQAEAYGSLIVFSVRRPRFLRLEG